MEMLNTELLALSPYRKRNTLPKPSPYEIEHAQRYGIITPVVVRTTPRLIHNSLHYEILQNEMAWFIAQRIGLLRVPVSKVDVSDEEAEALLRMAPNNPIDEARQIQEYLKKYPQSIAEMARKLGRNRVDVSNQLRLLTLDNYCQILIRDNKLTIGQAKPLITLAPNQQRNLAQQAVIKKWSSRKLEQKARELRSQDRSASLAPPTKNDANTRAIEEKISQSLGCPVRLVNGELTINFFGDLEILDGLLIQMGINTSEKLPEFRDEEFFV